MRELIVIVLATICTIFVIFLGCLGAEYVGQRISHKNFNQYDYIVKQDNYYWFTNQYEVIGNCIKFISNYNTEVGWCEKFQIETNYWKNNKPSLKTVWFGY